MHVAFTAFGNLHSHARQQGLHQRVDHHHDPGGQQGDQREVTVFGQRQHFGQQHLVQLGQHDPHHGGQRYAGRERQDRLDQRPVEPAQRGRCRQVAVGLGSEDQGLHQRHEQLKFEEHLRVMRHPSHQHQAAEVAQRGDDHVGVVQPGVHFQALQAALVQRGEQAQANHHPHQNHAVDDGLRLQCLGLQPMGGHPVAGQVHTQRAHQCHGQKHQLEGAHQPAADPLGRRAVAAALVMSDLAHQRRRHTGVEQQQPGLHHGVEADQAIGLGAQMAEVERHHQDADHQRIGLAQVAEGRVVDDRKLLHRRVPWFNEFMPVFIQRWPMKRIVGNSVRDRAAGCR